MNPETKPSTPSDRGLAKQADELNADQLDKVDGGATLAGGETLPRPPSPLPIPVPYPNQA
jgi:hypothetical protein